MGRRHYCYRIGWTTTSNVWSSSHESFVLDVQIRLQTTYPEGQKQVEFWLSQVSVKGDYSHNGAEFFKQSMAKNTWIQKNSFHGIYFFHFIFSMIFKIAIRINWILMENIEKKKFMKLIYLVLAFYNFEYKLHCFILCVWPSV